MNAATGRRWIWPGLMLILLAVCAIAVIHRDQRASMRAANAERKKAAQKKYKRAAEPVIVRSGMPNLRRRLDAKEPVTIAFIGGSITFNAGTDGFVSEIPAWLVSRFPASRVETINAGIPATGSDFGAQRVDRDVLVHRPDVVFIEFAVNDAGKECEADMERIVRKIRIAEPAADIVMIYTISSDTLPKLENGKFPGSVNYHEAVAEHYNLPTVALGYEAARRIRSGVWTWADFSADVCHPTPKGYESYNRDIDSALAALLEVKSAPANPLPPPLTPDLVVYPPPAKATPQPTPEPLLNEQGVPAKETDELPLFGQEWIGSNQFPTANEPRWRLYYRPFEPGVAVSATIGLDRQGWKPQEWFDETRSFTGRTSHTLATSKPDAGNLFGSSPFDESVLTWQARRTGPCIVVASASGIGGAAGSPEAQAGLNIVRFTDGSTQGESLAFQVTRRGEPLALRKSVEVTAGDTLAFVFHATAYKYAAYRNFRVTVGSFDPSKTSNAPPP